MSPRYEDSRCPRGAPTPPLWHGRPRRRVTSVTRGVGAGVLRLHPRSGAPEGKSGQEIRADCRGEAARMREMDPPGKRAGKKRKVTVTVPFPKGVGKETAAYPAVVDLLRGSGGVAARFKLGGWTGWRVGNGNLAWPCRRHRRSREAGAQPSGRPRQPDLGPPLRSGQSQLPASSPAGKPDG